MDQKAGSIIIVEKKNQVACCVTLWHSNEITIIIMPCTVLNLER